MGGSVDHVPQARPVEARHTEAAAREKRGMAAGGHAPAVALDRHVAPGCVEETVKVVLVGRRPVLADALVIPGVRRGDGRDRIDLPLEDPLPEVKVLDPVIAISRR